jgi:dTDP-glucose 4,6-dehydratase
MNLLVTGGAGFIGSEFVRNEITNNKNYNKIYVLDALTYAGNFENLREVNKNSKFNFVLGDIKDSKIVNELVSEVDLVINFAAESHVDKSILDATPFVENNILGTQVLLDAIRRNKSKRFIQISTDEVYGTIDQGEWDENFPVLPNSPYAASKAAADLLVTSYHHTYNLDLIITRSCNNFGPHQLIEKLIPLAITNLLRGDKIPIYGDGKNVREWIYVTDNCKYISALAEKGESGQIYNIGSGFRISNLELIFMILNIMQKDKENIEFVSDRLGHDYRYALNSNKAINLIENEFKSDFQNMLINTINWYREHPHIWDLKSKKINKKL